MDYKEVPFWRCELDLNFSAGLDVIVAAMNTINIRFSSNVGNFFTSY
jgi:hypothetical protein